jgi:hypothetical protein
LIYEHWFDSWAAGDWREPLAEHLWALNQYGTTDHSTGDQWARDDAATVGCRFVASNRSNRDEMRRRT